MNFIEELRWREMFHDATPGVEEHLNEEMRTGYIGFDPTAPSLTIGNFVQIQLLTLFQRAGHKPIVLMGGATGRIGDPSGKDKERDLKSADELDLNLEYQKKIIQRFLNFEEGPNKAEFRNNLDFYKNMNVIDFLRDVGKSLTINYMMSKESVKKRIDTGISFTEFSYQLLQGYDFQHLLQTANCTVQMGGSDQWGNITTGTEFIRRNTGGKAYAVTTPLLTKADGTKFGKSEKGNIWVDAAFTSPYKFYQFWVNADDRDVPKFLRYFTLKSKEETEAILQKHADNIQGLKAVLAEELTIRVHSEDAYRSVLNVSELLFNKKATREHLLKMPEAELQTVAEEIPTRTITLDALQNTVNIVDLLTDHTDILDSKSEARRAIKNNAISVNKEKIEHHEATLNQESLLHGKFLLIENGKKNKYIVRTDS